MGFPYGEDAEAPENGRSEADDIERLAHEALQKEADGQGSAEEAALRAAIRADKAARRKSMRGYVPVKRELSSTDLSRDDGDSSRAGVGNTTGNTTGITVGNSSIIGAVGAVAATQRGRRNRPLRGLAILVDVRAQDGEDASITWVDMLRNVGAKVYVRPVAEREYTHIVYKSGKPATLHAFRSHKDPKPFVVGVQWVLKCVQQGAKVDEEPYLIEIGKEAVFQKVSMDKNFLEGIALTPSTFLRNVSTWHRKLRQLRHQLIRPRLTRHAESRLSMRRQHRAHWGSKSGMPMTSPS